MVMKMSIEELIREMVMVPGVSGFEEPFRRYLLERLREYNAKTDNLGNVIVTLGDGKKHIAFVAHMDEIGLITTHIEDNGFIRFMPVGGVDNRMLYGRVVEIYTDNGIIYGVIGLSPPHLTSEEERKKMYEWKELAIDIGANSKDEAIRMGVKPMQPARWKKDFVVMGKHIVTKGLDDRVGCAILYESLKRLHRKNFKNKITFIWTLQEETGLRGASALASKYRFDEVYVIDTITSATMPNVDYHLSPAKLGDGPVLRVADRRGVASQYLREKVLKIAKNNGIPVQEAVSGGSTDASTMFEHGMNSIPICIPVKYTHSPVEMIHLADVKNLIDLIEKIAES